MTTLKITKKHHDHFNNPFPFTPASLPLIQGNLLFNSQTVPSHQQFSIGKDFQLSWSSNNGGSLSIYHQSQPKRAIWSTIPGQAFVSASLAETEVEKSRGSFVVKDRKLHLVCHHQTIQYIRVIDQFDHSLAAQDQDSPSGFLDVDQKTDSKGTQFPMVLVTGWVFNMRRKKKHSQKSGTLENAQFEGKGPSTCARYWVLFEQKNSNQIGFQVKLGQPNFEFRTKASPAASGRYKGFRRRLGQFQKRRLRWFWSSGRPRGFVFVSSSEEELEELKAEEVK